MTALEPATNTEPVLIPAGFSNVDTIGCHHSLFSPCIISAHSQDSIYSQDGVLHLYTLNKTRVLPNITTISTYNQPINGDFDLNITVENLDLSFSNEILPGTFLLNLNGKNGNILSSRISIEGNMWIFGTDTLREVYNGQPLAFEPCAKKLMEYQISRNANTLVAKVFYSCTDSLVRRMPDFGTQSLDLSFALTSDTAGIEYSRAKITKLVLKKSAGAVFNEDFCGDRSFIIK